MFERRFAGGAWRGVLRGGERRSANLRPGRSHVRDTAFDEARKLHPKRASRRSPAANRPPHPTNITRPAQSGMRNLYAHDTAISHPFAPQRPVPTRPRTTGSPAMTCCASGENPSIRPTRRWSSSGGGPNTSTQRASKSGRLEISGTGRTPMQVTTKAPIPEPRHRVARMVTPVDRPHARTGGGLSYGRGGSLPHRLAEHSHRSDPVVA